MLFLTNNLSFTYNASMENQIKKLNEISRLVGNTPLIKITYKYSGEIYNLFAKLEWYNLSGSIKDRIALQILKYAYQNNLITKDDAIIETTSGNTGISFSSIGRFLGHQVVIVMPEYMSEERKKLLKNYGAELVLVKKEEGGFLKCLEIASKFKGFKPLQFENIQNKIAHHKTANEIINICSHNNICIDVFISGVGTGGTLIGVAEKLKVLNSKIYAIEPASSPTLKTGKKIGTHKIEGISDEFVPKLYNRNLVNDIIDITDEEAISISQKLAKELGLGVGISSGANFAGAIKKQIKNKNIFTVFADDNKKYLSTDLSKPLKTELSENLKLLDFEVIG